MFRLALFAALALAACGPPAPNARPDAGTVSPAVEPARYVGRWAARPELCRDGAWRFETRRVATAGEVACDFDKVSPTASGYEIEARCTAEGASAPQRFTLTMTDPAAPEAMTVAGGPWSGATTLARCPS